MNLPERKIYTVSEFTEKIRGLLEKEYTSVWIQGEVSNFRGAPSGHMYFTLKDQTSQIRCVMFRLQAQFLKFRLEDGLKVIAWGRLAVYSPRGEYQLILDTMEPAGLGGLMMAFEQLKRKLEAEGLFDTNRKRPIPRFPSRVGVVTSATGAVVLDIIRIVRRRSPGTHVLVSPASVQGDRAPREIISALERLSSNADVDVIIIGRGGGSIEDLWAFNDEQVVRSVTACPVPVVSAVGHETDLTLTDFAADMRASTPSAAAEMVVPDRADLQTVIAHMTARLQAFVSAAIDRRIQVLEELAQRLPDPRREIEQRRIQIDDLMARARNAMSRQVVQLRRTAEDLASRLRPEHPARAVSARRDLCVDLMVRLERAARDSIRERRQNVQSLAGRLDALSPLSVLARGYSIALDRSSRAVINDASSVVAGQALEVILDKGFLVCEVQESIWEGGES